MHQSFEKPLFDASIFYFDTNFCRETAIKVVGVFEKNKFLPCSIVNLGKYTRGKFIKYKPEHMNLFVDAYENDGVVSIILETSDSRKSIDYCSIDFSMNKPDKELIKRLNELNPNRKPSVRWNVLSFYSTYGWMQNRENYNMMMNTLNELILILSPFCVKIDDLSHALRLRHSVHEPTFKPDYIQQVYWGNYWGEHLKEQVNMDELKKLPVFNLKETTNGVFFTLSNSVFDFDSNNCSTLRRTIWSRVIGK